MVNHGQRGAAPQATTRRGTAALRALAGTASTVRALGHVSLALSPWVPRHGPTRASHVTAEFVRTHVGGGVRGAVCERVVPLDGTAGTTDRRRLGLFWNEAGSAARLPASVFVKSTPLSAKNRTMVAALDMAVNEVRFYRGIRSVMGEHTPRAYFTYAGVGARFLLVLEDLVAQGCRPYALADECSVEHAAAVLDAQATLHAAMWNTPRFATDLRWVKRWSERPGYGVLVRFYRRGRKGALAQERTEITPAVRRVAAALDAHATDFYRHFERGPLTLLHGDSHLGNTYALPDGRAGYLDWQVVWQGPPLREVAYFLISGLEPERRRAVERELIEQYLEMLAQRGGTPPPFAEAFAQYRRFAAEIWDAAAMTIAWPGLQAPENVDASFRRVCIAVEDLDVAEAVERSAEDLR